MLRLVQTLEHVWSHTVEESGERPVLVIELLIVHVLGPRQELGRVHTIGQLDFRNARDDELLQTREVVILGKAHELKKFTHTSRLIFVFALKSEVVSIQIVDELSKGFEVVIL